MMYILHRYIGVQASRGDYDDAMLLGIDETLRRGTIVSIGTHAILLFQYAHFVAIIIQESIFMSILFHPIDHKVQ